ncbi:response regulator transcription factor [Megasphaera sp.]|uniref:response regulator transcription factor n=2 Tax=Megasphaera sp. TaxID=2023260 RepID=UPI00307ABDE8
MEKILIADDEQLMRQLVIDFLKPEGYEILEASDGKEALEIYDKEHPDLILLDVMMPGYDGWTVCREIRRESTVPIMMLTAKGEEIDQLFAYDLGADEYITKPFSPREVIARVKAVLRRLHEIKDESKGTIVRIENLEIDMSAFIVKLNDQPVPCTPKEIEILYTLASNPGKVFSREHLLQSIWGYDFLGDTRAVDSHIKRMRAKLCLPENRWDIKTVWGVGYRFEIGE